MDKRGKSEDNKEKRKAKRALSVLLDDLKKIHDTYDKIKDINDKIETLRSIVKEYDVYLRPQDRAALEDAMKFTDTSPDGIKNTLEALKIAVKNAKNVLPGPIVSAGVVGISIAVLVVMVAVTTYVALMGTLSVTNDGCQVISAVQQFTQIPSIASGETKKIPVPKVQVSIESTSNMIELYSSIGSLSMPIPDRVIDVQLDAKSISGIKTSVNFGDGIEHHLTIICKS